MGINVPSERKINRLLKDWRSTLNDASLRKYRLPFHVAFLFSLLFSSIGVSQEIGIPPFTYFSPQDYNAGNRNWSIVSDSTGVTYVANSEGVLIYDGISWEKVELPENHVAYWVEKDKKGNIFIGANGDFGQLKSDANGAMYYHSFLGKLEEQYLDFNVVWEIAQSGEGVVFRSKQYLFHYLDNDLKVINVPENGTAFDVAFAVEDTVYTRVYGLGLAYADQKGLHILPNTEFFAERKVNGIYRYGEDQLLVATRKEGLYLYSGDEVVPFKTEADAYLLENRIYDGHHLSNGSYALATMANGIVIINPNGQEEFRFDASNGLGNNQTLYIREVSGQLWLGTKNGIIQMAYNAPYRQVGKEFGLKGQVTSIFHKDDKTYVTCNDGFYQLVESGQQMKFEAINQDVIIDCVNTFEYEGELYFSSLEGTFKYGLNGQIENISNHNPRKVVKSDYPGVFVAPGFYHGLLVLQFKDGHMFGERIMDINRLITQLIPVGEDVFWAKSIDDELFEVKVEMDHNNSPKSKILRKTQLPKDTYMVQLDDQVYFITRNTLYSFVDGRLRQLINPVKFYYTPQKIVYTKQLNSGQCFICYEDEFNSYYCEKFRSDGEEIILSTKEHFYSAFRPEVLYEEMKGSKLWLGGARGLNVYTSASTETSEPSPKTLIRRLTVNSDSVIRHAWGENSYVFQHHQNDLKISYISNSSLNDGKTLYQYRLVGRKGWSDWSEEKHTVFSNLNPGNYTFEVRSTSPHRGVTQAAQISFLIEKPWYTTNGAFILYLIGLLSLMYLFYRLRVRSLYKRQEELATMVTETTSQLAKANALLNDKADRLEKLGEFKSRFFANISHDLRTPIMLLSGRIELLKSDEDSYLSHKGETYLNKLQEDSKKLVLLTDEIKELIKLEEGKVTLNYKKIDINLFINRIIGLFESAADAKSTSLLMESQIPEGFTVAADPHYLERIMYNLISNALKFTPVNGAIKIILHKSESQVFIEVRDNGIGIAPEHVTEVFERSFQADNPYHSREGLGIGLNVVKELVNLHHGSVAVTSQLDSGTTFRLSLPDKNDLDIAPYEELSVGQYIEKRDPLSHVAEDLNPLLQLHATKTKETDRTKLLLVEDNFEVRDYLLELLQDEYKVHVANNGQEAISVLKKYQIDIIVTDLMMPVMDGFEFIEEIKQTPSFKDLPVLVISARDTKEDRYQIMQLGVNNILAKPFDRKEFSLKLRNLVLENSQTPTLSKVVRKVDEHHQTQLEKLNGLIVQHIDDPHLKVAVLAEHFNLSERSFFRLVKSITGKSPLEYVKDFKFNYAYDLLQRNKVQSIKEVTYAIGMKNTTDFNKQFERRFRTKASKILKEYSL